MRTYRAYFVAQNSSINLLVAGSSNPGPTFYINYMKVEEVDIQYVPEVTSWADYYAFGWVMPGRDYNNTNDDYRFGFNGQEKDDEVKGTGNSYDFGARMYDPRLGRFLSTDPLHTKTPHSSPYLFAANNPNFFIDNHGEDAVGYIGEDGKLYISATYYAVSEGIGGYTEVEMKQIENTANAFWSQAKGMTVTLSDGRTVEVGGVTIQVKPGGNFGEAQSAAVNSGSNLLAKVPGEKIKAMSKEGKAEAVTYTGFGKSTLNSTLLNGDQMGKFMIGDEKKNFDNAVIDETGHVMGTRHPEKQGEESMQEYNARRERDYGDLERGNKKATGVLDLSQKDLQNIVTSKEFKLIENPAQ